MAIPATEVVSLPLIPGIDIEDPNTAAGKVWSDTLALLRDQEGYQRSYYGRHVESPNLLHFLVDWDSIDAHTKFTTQTYYETMVKNITSILDSPVNITHTKFSPHPPSPAANSSVTEVVALYFPSTISDSEKSSFEESIQKFKKICEDHANGYKGFASGWVVEELEHEEMEGKAKVYQCLLGWESVEAHLAFRETQEFQDNIYLMRPSNRKAAKTHHKEYCPPIDSALFRAIVSDYDLSTRTSLEEARSTLDVLKAAVDTEVDATFDPSGSNDLHSINDTSSLPESGDLAQPWQESSLSDDTEASSTSLQLASLSVNEATTQETSGQTGILVPEYDRALESLPSEAKQEILQEMFPTARAFDISFTLRKYKGDFAKTIEDLLNQAFLDSETSSNHGGGVRKGIENFSEPSTGRGRKLKGKSGRRNRRTSSTPGLTNGSHHELNAVPNRWDCGNEDISFVSKKTYLSSQLIASVYHQSGGSLPSTIIALCTSTNLDPNPHVASVSSGLIEQHVADLGHDFPTLPASHVKALIYLTHPSTASAHELARVLVATAEPVSTKVVPQYLPWTPSPTETNASIATPSLPLSTATHLASASLMARSDAFNKASNAYRKSKSKPLMGGAASYYSSVGRDLSASMKRYEAAAADARVASQSRAGEVDLHGVNVQDAVRIVRDKVWAWWEAEGKEWAREGKVLGGNGLKVVTGIGRHSHGGRGKIGPAVGAMLVKEGWKVEIGDGAVLIIGRARR
ncbi:MAG: hypothetical protein Q9167_004337 [Letrouitia subvulpina]